MTQLVLERQLDLARSITDVFRYLDDFSTIEQWDPGVLTAEKMDPGTPAVGTRFALVLRLPGRQVPMTYTLITRRPPEGLMPAVLSLKGCGDGFAATDTLTLTPLPSGHTRLDYRAELDLGKVPALLKPMLSVWGQRLAEQAMHGLRQALEQDGPVTPSWYGRAAERLVLPGLFDFTRRGYRHMPSRGLSRYLNGRKVGITGVTSGLGLAAAQQLGRLGAQLVLVGRDRDRLAETALSVREFAGMDVAISLIEAELSSVAEGHRLADLLLAEHPDLDVWINNAGALFAARDETTEGHERTLAINLIVPALLSRRLAPMLGARDGRLINVVSGGLYTQALSLDDMNSHSAPFNGAKAYARAKRGLLDLSQRWAADPLLGQAHWHVMHPGWAATPGVAKSLPDFNRRLQPWLRNARMGADTMVWLASHPALADHSLSGSFWFDRAQRPGALLPGTATSSADVDRLATWLDHVTQRPPEQTP